MPHYRAVGQIPRKRHTVQRLGGRVTPEELIGIEGFSGRSSLLYHRNSPSAIVRIESLPEQGHRANGLRPNSDARPHHLRSAEVPMAECADPVGGRVVLLGNDDVTVSVVTATDSGGLYRSAIGDELIYVQDGTARLESVFGSLAVGPGDYVLIPSGVTHRWVLGAPLTLLVIAGSGHIDLPARYLNGAGQLLEGAPFSERDLRGPDPEPLIADGEEVAVLVRTRAGDALHVHATHPFDVVGWDGCVYPWALNIADFEPIVGRIHQPPPVHQTFAGPGFVVCSFVPRPFDFDPSAVKVPYHHANVDTDEVLYYSRGEFMSRAGSGIGAGSISLHPAGFSHGPQPGSFERSLDAPGTEETAVMLDAFSPLALSAAALAVSDPAYPWTWSAGGEERQ